MYPTPFMQEGESQRRLPKSTLRSLCLLFLLIVPSIVSQIDGFGPSRDELAQTTEQGSWMSRVLFVALLVFAISMSVKHKTKMFWSKGVYVYIGYLCMGVLYSAYPQFVIRGVFVAGTSLFLWTTIGYYLSRELHSSSDALLKLVPLFSLTIGSLDALLWLILPTRDEGYMGQFVGYLLQPNLLAKLIAVGIPFLVFDMSIRGYRLKSALHLFALVLLLYATGSRTAVIASVTAILIVYLLAGKAPSSKKLALVLSSTVVVFLLTDALGEFLQKGGEFELLERSSLAFRFQLWQELLPLMFQNVLLGAGLNSFWNPDTFYYITVAIGGIHNGYLQVFQDLGAIGLLLLSVAYFPIVKSTVIRQDLPDYEAVRISLISMWVFFAVTNMTEGDLGQHRSSLWAITTTLTIAWYRYTHVFNETAPSK